jgi:hypothetical protein
VHVKWNVTIRSFIQDVESLSHQQPDYDVNEVEHAARNWNQPEERRNVVGANANPHKRWIDNEGGKERSPRYTQKHVSVTTSHGQHDVLQVEATIIPNKCLGPRKLGGDFAHKGINRLLQEDCQIVSALANSQSCHLIHRVLSKKSLIMKEKESFKTPYKSDSIHSKRRLGIRGKKVASIRCGFVKEPWRKSKQIIKRHKKD